MVLREGAETVLILSAVTLNSTELMSFLGTLAGVLAAIAFGVMFVKGSVRINLQKFFRVTTAIFFWWRRNWSSPACTSFRKTGSAVVETGNGDCWTDRSQRVVFFRDYRGAGRLDDSV